MINKIFDFWVSVMEQLAHFTGLSYKGINILVFLIIHPLITIYFMIKYYKTKKKKYN